ncbi:MAG: class I SAM-dependent methyltransferase [Clostridiales bacterium]|nr:class I SAM-dependent methyltransferase [Clostridiales bacterium]
MHLFEITHLKKGIVLFGAGKIGRTFLKHLPRNSVRYIVDNYRVRELNGGAGGGGVYGVKVISFSELCKLYDKKQYDIILTVANSDDIQLQLDRKEISYYTLENLPAYVNEYIDYQLLQDFQYDYSMLQNVFTIPLNYENWYRQEFYDEENKALVHQMKCRKSIVHFLDRVYKTNQKFSDEYYSKRPGMRLVRNILLQDKKRDKVCDFAAGHGELLFALKKDGYSVKGCDASNVRIKELLEKEMDATCCMAEKTPYEDNQFDSVICLELLEHVANPEIVLKEIGRVLKTEGKLFLSVPLGRDCDCRTHVRFFDENLLYSLVLDSGFEVVNIMKIPYVNDFSAFSLFCVGMNRK